MLHNAIYEKLKSVARDKKIIPYSDVAPLANLVMSNPDHRKQLAEILCEISKYEHSQGRPMLSAVVTHKNDPIPGHGFFTLARELGLYRGHGDMEFLAEELKRVWSYWSNQPAN